MRIFCINKKHNSVTFVHAWLLLLFIFLLPCHSLFAQVGINTKSPDSSSALHVEAQDKGILIPRLTEQKRNNIQNPAVGLMIYNIDNKCLETHSEQGRWRSHCGEEKTAIPNPRPDLSYKGNLGSCKNIRDKYPNLGDGEYDLTVNGQKFKTFCDMGRGGYTLIWSYSSNTAYHEYTPRGIMTVSGSAYAFSDKNTQTTGGINFPPKEAINYENYRISKQAMEDIGMNSFRVVMTHNPRNPNDSLALDNYAESDRAREVFYQQVESKLPGKGKIEGRSFNFANGEGYLQGGTQGPLSYFKWSQAGNAPLHIRVRGDAVAGNEYQDIFGFFEQRAKSGFFGICRGASQSLVSYCASKDLSPQPKDQERYIQWWLK